VSSSVAVLLNAQARKVTRQVVDRITRALPSDSVYVSSDLDEAEVMTNDIMSRRFQTVLTGGGDGTLVRFLKHSLDYVDRHGTLRDYPLIGVLKLGTGNGISSFVGAGPYLRDLAIMTRSGRSKHCRRLSLIEVEGAYCPFAGFGLDAMILNDYSSHKESWAARRLKYAFTVPTISIPKQLTVRRRYPVGRIINEGRAAYLIDPHGRPVGSPIETGQTIYHGPVLIAGVATMPYYGYGMKLYPFVERCSGVMQLRISWAGTAEALARLPDIWKGTYRSATIQDYYCDRVRMVFDHPTPFQIGGDGVGVREDVTFSVSHHTVDLIDLTGPRDRTSN
jgi:diacylglycerol kinase family enzyme